MNISTANERTLKGAYESFLMPGLPEADTLMVMLIESNRISTS